MLFFFFINVRLKIRVVLFSSVKKQLLVVGSDPCHPVVTLVNGFVNVCNKPVEFPCADRACCKKS